MIKFHAEFPDFFAEFTDLLTVRGVVPKRGGALGV